jgi:uncharacterized protein (TIGR04255 family)
VAKAYKRAPITEAVIEIRIKAPFDAAQLDRLVARFSRKYPVPPQKLFDVSFEIGEVTSKTNQKLNGYRMSSSDGDKVLLLGMSNISTAKIAPYEGWEKLSEEARSNWDIWLKIVGWQPVGRIGIRYINRIDIPTLGRIELKDYLTFQPSLPPLLDTGIQHFAMNTMIQLGKDGRLVLNAGSVASPIIGNQSLILDLDVSCETDIPDNDVGLWTLIAAMRDQKNQVFEACITDKTRALFE